MQQIIEKHKYNIEKKPKYLFSNVSMDSKLGRGKSKQNKKQK